MMGAPGTYVRDELAIALTGQLREAQLETLSQSKVVFG